MEVDVIAGQANSCLAEARLLLLGGPSEWERIRRDAGVSRQTLADRLGVTRQSPWQWERGRSRPRGVLAERYLAELVRLSAAAL